MEYLNYNNFKREFNQIKNQKHLTIAQITRNAGFSHSYVYNIVNHDRDNISIKTVTKLSKGLGLNQDQTKSFINRIKFIHPVNTKTNYGHRLRHQAKVRHLKQIKHTKRIKRIDHKRRYKLNGRIMHKLVKLNVYDKHTVLILINRLLKQESHH